jgi:hypothetical protein
MRLFLFGLWVLADSSAKQTPAPSMYYAVPMAPPNTRHHTRRPAAPTIWRETDDVINFLTFNINVFIMKNQFIRSLRKGILFGLTTPLEKR